MSDSERKAEQGAGTASSGAVARGPHRMPPGHPTPVRVLLRGLEIIEALNRHGPLTTAALSQKLRLARTTVNRCLATLEAEGYVERLPNRRHALTLRAATLSHGFDLAAERLEPVCAQMRGRFGHRATMQAWSAVTAEQATGSRTHLLEIYALDCDKWTMLERVRGERGVPAERVVAVGDGLNDLLMIREAAVGIAMGNADPRVLEHADHVAPHHAEDGFAHAIERLLGGELDAWRRG